MELLERAGLLWLPLLPPVAPKDPVAPALKSMAMELVGDGDKPFMKEPVGLLAENWKGDWTLLLWKGLLLLAAAVLVVGVVTEWLVELLLDFFWRELGDTDDPEPNWKPLLFWCEVDGLLMGVMIGIPLNRASRGEDAAEDALDWVSWSSSESDCIVVSYKPGVTLLCWFGVGIVILMLGVGFEGTVSM